MSKLTTSDMRPGNRIHSNDRIGNGNVVYGGIWNMFTQWDGDLSQSASHCVNIFQIPPYTTLPFPILPLL